MSQELIANANAQIVEALTPKVLANHASKVSGMESFQYADVLEMMSDGGIPMLDRMSAVARAAGQPALVETLEVEATVMSLVALGREGEVADPDRVALYSQVDREQVISGRSPKNLDYFLGGGIEVYFGKAERAAAGRFCELDERVGVPLIERAKSLRVLNINGFEDSRVMYAVHDLIDHAWLFDTLREHGIFERYGEFLDSIDLGGESALYSRQAELVASVGFGNRRWKVAEAQGEQPVLKHEDIDYLLSLADDPRTANARQILNGMSPSHLRQAIFMIENMGVQTIDERRRWGAVKVRGSDGASQPMDLFSPLHIAMMVESLDIVQHSETYGRVQLAATVSVDDMLREALAEPDGPEMIRIPIPLLRPGGNLPIPDEGSPRVEWIRDHLSVSTSYGRLV